MPRSRARCCRFYVTPRSQVATNKRRHIAHVPYNAPRAGGGSTVGAAKKTRLRASCARGGLSWAAAAKLSLTQKQSDRDIALYERVDYLYLHRPNITPNRAVNRQRKAMIMGDKSPKSVNKQASQKQAKANAEAQKKKQAAAAKQVPGKK